MKLGIGKRAPKSRYAKLRSAVKSRHMKMHRRREKVACPCCDRRRLSYSYTVRGHNAQGFDSADHPQGRRYCSCGYAESPLSEDLRAEWEKGL